MQQPEQAWVRVCLEESSIVFGPRTSVPSFFSGLQETWPPCAEKPLAQAKGEEMVEEGGTMLKCGSF